MVVRMGVAWVIGRSVGGAWVPESINKRVVLLVVI